MAHLTGNRPFEVTAEFFLQRDGLDRSGSDEELRAWLAGKVFI